MIDFNIQIQDDEIDIVDPMEDAAVELPTIQQEITSAIFITLGIDARPNGDTAWWGGLLDPTLVGAEFKGTLRQNTEANRLLAASNIRTALQPLVDSGTVATLQVTAEEYGISGVLFRINITEPETFGSERVTLIWDATRESLINGV